MALFILATILIGALMLLIPNRKLLLYYFIILYPILPEYLAVSVSSSLPLFTASRLLLIIMIISVMSKRKINISIFKEKLFGRSFSIFLMCELMWFIRHINDIDSIKSFIGVILENMILVIVLTNSITSKEKYDGCIKALFIGASIVFSMGILEPITRVNLASTFLDTGSRDNILISVYERYNSVRAVFTFGHAIALGVYCVTLLPLIMYVHNKTQKTKYLLLYLAGLGCMLMTMSRGIIVAYFVVFILQISQLNKRERRGYLKVVGSGFMIVLLAILVVPQLFEVAKETVLGTLNAFGANFAVSSSGQNEDALLSRFAQLTMLPQVLKRYPLFGGGTGFIQKNAVFVYLTNRSFRARSIDIEYLQILLDKGIVGLVGSVVLYASLLKMTLNNARKFSDGNSRAFFAVFLSIFLSYFTVAQLTTGRILWTLISLYLSYTKLYLVETNETSTLH